MTETLVCANQAENLFSFWNKYIGQNNPATVSWSRTGKQVFGIFEVPKFRELFGKTGRLRLACESPNLPIEKLGFAYDVADNGDITFDVEPVAVKGLIQKYEEEVGNIKNSQGIDPITILTILSIVRSIWLLFNPVADVYLGGDISATGIMDGDVLTIKFQQMPEIRIVSIFSFKLGVREVQLTQNQMTLFFTGSRIITQKTFTFK